MSKPSEYNSGLLSELLDGILEKEQAKTDKRMLLAVVLMMPLEEKDGKRSILQQLWGKDHLKLLSG